MKNTTTPKHKRKLLASPDQPSKTSKKSKTVHVPPLIADEAIGPADKARAVAKAMLEKQAALLRKRAEQVAAAPMRRSRT